jgi:hypothetical protein
LHFIIKFIKDKPLHTQKIVSKALLSDMWQGRCVRSRHEYTKNNPAGTVKKFNDDSDRIYILTVKQARDFAPCFANPAQPFPGACFVLQYFANTALART